MYGSNRSLLHKNKGKEKIFKPESRYYYRSCYGLVQKTQYDNKREISTTDLVETTLLTRYPWPTEITYDQGLKLLVMI